MVAVSIRVNSPRIPLRIETRKSEPNHRLQCSQCSQILNTPIPANSVSTISTDNILNSP